MPIYIFFCEQITRNIEIDDDKGRKMKAIEVFGAVINYLKDHLLNLLRTRGTEVQNQDIHWVLTVPAIWSDSAKQFMREAAYKVFYLIIIITAQFLVFMPSQNGSIYRCTCL